MGSGPFASSARSAGGDAQPLDAHRAVPAGHHDPDPAVPRALEGADRDQRRAVPLPCVQGDRARDHQLADVDPDGAVALPGRRHESQPLDVAGLLAERGALAGGL